MKKRFKDRKDAKRIDNIDGLTQISIDLKPNRSISNVYINKKMNVTNLVKFIQQKKENNENITYFPAFLTAFAKMFYNRPKLNRFIANRHVYEHNKLIFSFVAKISFDDKSEEVMVLIPIEKDDNLDSITKKIKDKLNPIRNKNSKKEEKGASKAVAIFGNSPNFIRVPVVGLVKFLDKKGLMPKFLIKDNIYYSSMIASNLGSIHCDAIFHNINDFGTCSLVSTFGEIKDMVVAEKGKPKVEKVCEFGINLDERIADGYYCAKSLILLEYVLMNPNLLEEKVGKEIKLDEIR